MRLEEREVLQGEQSDSPPALELRVAETGRMVLARIVGPLDAANTAEFVTEIGRRVLRERVLVVDLRLVDFLDSTGVRGLLRVGELVTQHTGEFRLIITPGSRVERTLRLLQLLEQFSVFPSASAAWIARPSAHRRRSG